MDTIIIKIYGPNKFRFRNRSLFLPELTCRKYEELSPTEIQSRNSSRPYLKKFILHPKAADEYIPSVEVFETLSKEHNKIIYILKITFSAPKLLYWNSLQEVGEKDKDKLFFALRSALESVGIVLEIETIANAILESVHACKNIPLPKTIRMREIINELAKVDISKAFDVADKQDKKGARVLNIHSGTIEWSFYDKISDALRPKNKRSDKGRIDHEKAIVELYKLQEREVFRYEYRLKKTQTTKREINKLLGRDKKTQVVFKDIFTPNLLKTLVLNSWHKIMDLPENQLSLFGEVNELGFLLHIFFEAVKNGTKANSMDNAFASYGLAIAIRKHGAKELKGAVFDVWNRDHPERLKKKMKRAMELMKGLPISHNIAFIDKALERYELINLTSLEKGI
ncbi:MAG: hypothetical protein NTZ87_00275 [Candidatus Nomurabacteria bacterium]|nr:hypothetical protein [Candidatus Nomurabacteria bacterium]